jgi:hypothetical protein
MIVTIDVFWIYNWIYWTHTAHDYTLQITITHRPVFSVTLLSNGFQWQMFLCFQACVLSGLQPSHTNLWLLASAVSSWAELTSCCLKTNCGVRMRVTLWLAVYHQSFRLGTKPLEAHDQSFLFQRNPYSHSSCLTFSLMRVWVCLLWICLAFFKCTYLTYSMLLKILPSTIYTSPLSVQALQSRSCLSYLTYATTAAYSLECLQV